MGENEDKEEGTEQTMTYVAKCRHSKENKRSRGCAIGSMKDIIRLIQGISGEIL